MSSQGPTKKKFFSPIKKEREKGGMLNAMSYYFIFMWHTVVVSWRLGKFDLMQQQLLYIISARKLDKRRQRRNGGAHLCCLTLTAARLLSRDDHGGVNIGGSGGGAP